MDNMDIIKIGDEVVYNGYIPENIPSYKKYDLSRLTLGESYTVLELSSYYGEIDDRYTWYRIEGRGGYKLWYPCISFDIMDIKKKYDLR